MHTDIRPSAKIYQFPTRERRPARPGQSLRGIVRDMERETVCAVSSWYHDAAILEEKTRKS